MPFEFLGLLLKYRRVCIIELLFDALRCVWVSRVILLSYLQYIQQSKVGSLYISEYLVPPCFLSLYNSTPVIDGYNVSGVDDASSSYRCIQLETGDPSRDVD